LSIEGGVGGCLDRLLDFLDCLVMAGFFLATGGLVNFVDELLPLRLFFDLQAVGVSACADVSFAERTLCFTL
jgi:hypothetical protein